MIVYNHRIEAVSMHCYIARVCVGGVKTVSATEGQQLRYDLLSLRVGHRDILGNNDIRIGQSFGVQWVAF